jgi:beta-lactamase class A
MKQPTRALVFCWLVALAPGPTFGQSRDSTALERRAAQITAAINGVPLGLDTIFTAGFLAQLPATRMHQLFTQLTSQLGAIDSVSKGVAGAQPATNAVFQLLSHKGLSVPMTVNISATPPSRVDGLFFGTPTKPVASLDELMREFARLPGHVSVLAARVDGSSLVQIVGLDTSSARGIGSAFKLFILAELVHEIEAGTRRWKDVVSLDDASRSLPSGVLQTWPTETAVTLQTLATLMISQSDNTAADELLHVLGRERIERIQTEVGNAHAARNAPFLTTREMFLLKSPASSALIERFRSGTSSTRRAVLAEVDQRLYSDIAPDFSHGPVAIDSVEWFASANDLARTIVWIRDHTANGEASRGRGVLSVNPGIAWPVGRWP